MTASPLNHIARQQLAEIRAKGLYKSERQLLGPQQAEIQVAQGRVLNLCANNYLGLANHPAIIEAAGRGLHSHGYGMTGEAYLMIGDAFAFIDPVFSSGVHLAINSGTIGAEVVDAFLRGAADYPARRRNFERKVRRGIDTFSWFIHRFNQPAFEALFVSARRPPKIERAVLSLLAGDVFGQSKMRIPLFLFKVVYYIVFLLNWRENWAVARRRKQGSRTTVTEVTDYAVKTT